MARKMEQPAPAPNPSLPKYSTLVETHANKKETWESARQTWMPPMFAMPKIEAEGAISILCGPFLIVV